MVLDDIRLNNRSVNAVPVRVLLRDARTTGGNLSFRIQFDSLLTFDKNIRNDKSRFNESRIQDKGKWIQAGVLFLSPLL
jgi:hypothetical protein